MTSILFEYGNHSSFLLTIFIVCVLLYFLFKIKLYQQQHAYPISFVDSPPFNLSPGVLRFITQKRVSTKIFICTIIFFAEQGFIRIDKRGGQFYLTNTGKDQSQLSEYIKKTLQNLFFEKNAILVSGDSIFSDVSALINARKIFNEGIRQVCNASYFNSDFYQKLPFIVPALILLIIALIVNLYALPSIYTQQSEIILLTLVNISLLRKIFRCMRTYYTNFYLYQSSIISFRLISGFVLFLIISIVSLVYLVFIHQDNHTPMTLIILAWLFFVNLSLITSKLLNKNGIKLLNQIQGFKLYLLMRFINDLGSGNDSRKIEKYLSYVIALDIEKQWIKSIHLKMKDNNLFNSFYCPDWLTGISLEKKTFIDCIFYEFLPAVSSLMLVEDFSRRRFAYMVDSNTDF